MTSTRPNAPEDVAGRASRKKKLAASLGDAAPAAAGTFDGRQVVRMLDPHFVRPSPWANRDRRSFEASDFDRLKTSVAATGGNLQPIKVRRVSVTNDADKTSPDESFEIVFGHRRHRACLELGLPVSAIVAALTDRELFAEMDRENRTNKPLSPYEQGCMFRQALDMALYESARALAEDLDVDTSVVSKSLSIARLPAAVLDAFVSPLDIQYRWAGPLNDANRRDSAALVTRAQLIQIDRHKLTSVRIFQRLVSSRGSPSQATLRIAGPKNKASIGVDARGRIAILIDPPWNAKWTQELEQVLRDLLAHPL